MNIFESIGNGIIKLINEVKAFLISLNVPAFIDTVKKKVLLGLSNILTSYQTRLSEKKRQETIGGSSSSTNLSRKIVQNANRFGVSPGSDVLSLGRNSASAARQPQRAGLSLTTPSDPLAAAATQLTSRDGWDRLEVGRAGNGLPAVMLKNTKNGTAKMMTLEQFRAYIKELANAR